MNTLLIIGATSTMASNCARLWVTDSKKNFEKVVLVARNKEKLSVIANDLKARSANKIEIKELYADFSDENSVIQLCDEIKQEEGEFTTVLIAHGVLSDNTKCRDNYHLISSSITVNSTSVAILLESIVAKMNKDQNKGNIGVIGSVAGDRGRASNYIYGAAKGFVEKYVEGMQHFLALTKSKIKITLIKPGQTRTAMTANLDNSKFAPVEVVARDIVKAVNHGKKTVYTPYKWKIIMTVIRWIPSFIFNRINI